MAFHTCLFLVAATPDDRVALIRRRIEALRRYFAAYAPATAHVRELPEHRALAGCIALGADDDALTWGSIETGPGAAISIDAGGVRLLTSPVDVTAAYRAGDVVSTHAVAAAHLAHGSVRLDPAVLAELLAFGHPAGDGHLVAGVEAIPAGSELFATSRGLAAAGRLARPPFPPEDDAHAVAEAALRGRLRRWSKRGSLALGLTAGLDSRVLAALLRDEGIAFTGYTWGPPGADDVVGGTAAATALGVPHVVVAPTPLADEDVVAHGRRDAVWTEGCAPLGLLAAAPAPDCAVNVTGAGGELGRAFHYALLARNHAHPSPKALRRAWRPDRTLPAPIDEDARDRVRAAAAAALERAAATGAAGWRVLDVVYAQQRMRRFTRSRIAPTTGPALAPAFLEPQVAAALVALPLADRVGETFHRATLARLAPALVPAPRPVQRAHVPALARRAAAAWRARRPQPSGGPGLAEHPATRRHLAGHVARHALVVDGLGEACSEWLAGDDPHAERAALTLAGAVALAEAVEGLHRADETVL